MDADPLNDCITNILDIRTRWSLFKTAQCHFNNRKLNKSFWDNLCTRTQTNSGCFWRTVIRYISSDVLLCVPSDKKSALCYIETQQPTQQSKWPTRGPQRTQNQQQAQQFNHWCECSSTCDAEIASLGHASISAAFLQVYHTSDQLLLVENSI